MSRTSADIDALTDELLAIRCQLGEGTAFDSLIARWNPPLWRYVRSLVEEDEDASEVLQDVWLRVLRGMPGLRDATRLRAWLFGIARRAAMDRLRRQYAVPVPEPVEVDDLPAPEQEAGREDEIGLMQEELAGMPVTEREVLVLFYLQELTLAQVAEVLAVPVGTVKSRLHRARQLLHQRLTQRGVQP